MIAKGAVPDNRLFDQLVAAGLTAYRVGDCGEAGYILGAIRTAADVAARI